MCDSNLKYKAENAANLFFFQGIISLEKQTEILSKVEAVTKPLELPKNIAKKCYHLSVELLQNYHHHIYSESENKMPGKYKEAHYGLGQNQDNLFIFSGNFIKNEDVSALEHRLTILNDLSEKALKELYQATLSNGAFSAKGTAGLGWMDILKKTKQRIRFNFEYCNADFSYFSTTISIKTNKQ